MLAKRVFNYFGVLLPEERSLVVEEAVQFFAGEGQEGGEHDLERVNGFECGVNRLARFALVHFDGRPRRIDIEILIDYGGEFHRFA